MMLATDLAVLDHARRLAAARRQRGQLRRHRRAGGEGVGRRRRQARPHDRRPGRSRPTAPSPPRRRPAVARHSARCEQRHRRRSSRTWSSEAKEDIRAGEVFQVVLSQRFSTPCRADALDVYRALRTSNPSPYMYLFRLPLAGRHGIRRRRAPPRKPWSRSPAAAPSPTPSPDPGRGARRRRRTSPWRRTCSPTPRSAPSTSCSSTSAATTSSGSAGRAPSTWWSS